jgi:hypothetical protein
MSRSFHLRYSGTGATHAVISTEPPWPSDAHSTAQGRTPRRGTPTSGVGCPRSPVPAPVLNQAPDERRPAVRTLRVDQRPTSMALGRPDGRRSRCPGPAAGIRGGDRNRVHAVLRRDLSARNGALTVIQQSPFGAWSSVTPWKLGRDDGVGGRADVLRRAPPALVRSLARWRNALIPRGPLRLVVPRRSLP